MSTLEPPAPPKTISEVAVDAMDICLRHGIEARATVIQSRAIGYIELRMSCTAEVAKRDGTMLDRLLALNFVIAPVYDDSP